MRLWLASLGLVAGDELTKYVTGNKQEVSNFLKRVRREENWQENMFQRMRESILFWGFNFKTSKIDHAMK